MNKMSRNQRVYVNLELAWRKKFVPEIKRIFGELLIEETPFDELTSTTVDLSLNSNGTKIMTKVRRIKYLEEFLKENIFTIRASRPMSGNKTEIDKIMDGKGTHYFYGFSDSTETRLSPTWFIGDLNIFRTEFSKISKDRHLDEVGFIQYNHTYGDEFSTYFKFELDTFPDEFIIKKNGF